MTYDAYTARAYGAARRHAVTIAEVRVLDSLERCDRRYRKATPRVETLAAWARCSTRTVIRATRRLEDAGRLLIVRATPYVGANGRWTRARTNLYRVLMPHNTRSYRGDTAVTPIASRCDSDAGGRRSPEADRPPAPVRLTVVPDVGADPEPEPRRAGLDYVAGIMRAIRTGRTHEIPDPAE